MSTARRTRRDPAKTIEQAIAEGDFVSLPRAAKLADVTEQYMRALVRDGKVSGVRLGRNYLVSAAAARAFERRPNMGRPRLRTPKK